MTTVDATAGGAAAIEEAPAAVIGPLAGDPSILGLGSFIAGSVALGLGLVGVVPAGSSAPRSPSSWPPPPWACSWPPSGVPCSARAR